MTKQDLFQSCKAGSILKKKITIIHYTNRLKAEKSHDHSNIHKKNLTKSNIYS